MLKRRAHVAKGPGVKHDGVVLPSRRKALPKNASNAQHMPARMQARPHLVKAMRQRTQRGQHRLALQSLALLRRIERSVPGGAVLCQPHKLLLKRSAEQRVGTSRHGGCAASGVQVLLKGFGSQIFQSLEQVDALQARQLGRGHQLLHLGRRRHWAGRPLLEPTGAQQGYTTASEALYRGLIVPIAVSGRQGRAAASNRWNRRSVATAEGQGYQRLVGSLMRDRQN